MGDKQQVTSHKNISIQSMHAREIGYKSSIRIYDGEAIHTRMLSALFNKRGLCAWEVV